MRWFTETTPLCWSRDALLALFQKHFVIRYGLYRVQAELLDRGISLEISALGAKLDNTTTIYNSNQPNAQTLQPGTQLRDFYENLDNFYHADRAAVNAWIARFWDTFNADDQAHDAFHTLGLSAEASWPEVQQQYRALVQQHHPDKGGEGEHFMQVRNAYQVLKQRYGK